MVRSAHLATLALALGQSGVFGEAATNPKIKQRQAAGPNVLVIMTDDQDLLLDSLSVQPQIKSLIGGQGITYNNHYCTVAWCCPSRVNFFTGKAAHNTNVTNVKGPYGGWHKFQEEGLNSNYLPVWLQSAGINTYYVGKFMNGFSIRDEAKPTPPAGWTNSSFLVDPYTYNYLNSHWTTVVDAHGKADVEGFPGVHTTTVTQNKTLAMIEEAVASGQQWYMQIAPVAPHQQIGGGTSLPPIPPGYSGLYDNRSIPHSANFNPEVPSGSSWVHDLPRLDKDQLRYGQKMFFHRLANVAYVDAIVESFITKLQDLGQLNNTYVFYTTDNGYHIANHRMPPGKRCPYEEDVRIPMLLRGPDVPQGVSTSQYVSSHTEMAPTILKMLGVAQRPDFDAQPMAYTSSDLNGTATVGTELVQVEFWDAGNPPPPHVKGKLYYNNTYKALRMITGKYNMMYINWCTGQEEFYNMNKDPAQMQNRLANPPQGHASMYFGRNEKYLYTRLNALLMVTKQCAQEACYAPWSPLFPAGQVDSLEAAMVPEFDAFFANQPTIQWQGCPGGNIVSEQGPQNIIPYSASSKNVGKLLRRAETHS